MTTVALVERFDCDLETYLFKGPGAIRRLAWPDAGRTPWLLVISLIRDCMSALVHLRRFGRVHHDLKPDNILVSRSPPRTSPVTITYPGERTPRALPRAVVADFGHLVRVPAADGERPTLPELDIAAAIGAASARDAAAIGRAFAATVDSFYTWTTTAHAGVAGNVPHLSPEVASSFSASDALESRRPYLKQGAFEAGVLIHELLSPTGAVPDRRAPARLALADTRISTSSPDAEADLDTVCLAALALVHPDPTARMSLEAAYCIVEWVWAREVYRSIDSP
jgi:serine/threonine protein kinase